MLSFISVEGVEGWLCDEWRGGGLRVTSLWPRLCPWLLEYVLDGEDDMEDRPNS